MVKSVWLTPEMFALKFKDVTLTPDEFPLKRENNPATV